MARVMREPECDGCALGPACANDNWSWLFFVAGLAFIGATRVLLTSSQLFSKTAWYTGASLMLLFLVFRFRSLKVFSRKVQKSGIRHRLETSAKLSREDYALLSSLICRHDNPKSFSNFLVIFILSAIALLAGVIADMLL